MVYKAENIDTDKFLKQIKFLEDFDRENERAEKIAVERYHEAYRNCLCTVRDMFYCSNYEKNEVQDERNKV